LSDQKINIVDVATLANFFEVEERTIQNWVSVNGAPRSSRGEYDFMQFIKWRIRYLENEKKIFEAGGSKKAEAELEGINLQNIQRKQKIEYEL
jgi:phage terminase Nu1 subunit (DNA packaging protein)